MNEKASHDEIGRQSTINTLTDKSETINTGMPGLTFRDNLMFLKGNPITLATLYVRLCSDKTTIHYNTMRGILVPWLWCLFQHWLLHDIQFTISHKCTTNQYWLEWINSSSPAWLTVGITTCICGAEDIVSCLRCKVSAQLPPAPWQNWGKLPDTSPTQLQPYQLNTQADNWMCR